MRTSVFYLLSVIMCTLFLSYCKNETHKDLAQGINIKVEQVRTWDSYQYKFPAKLEKFKYSSWKSNNIMIENYYTTGSKLLSGSRTVQVGENSYSFTIKNFSRYKDKAAPEAKGRFCEFLITITNSGKEEKEITFISGEETAFNARLISPAIKNIGVSAFLFPKINASPISLITSWKGRLGVNLMSGSKTWFLLVFDIPVDINNFQLQLKDASPVPITIPLQMGTSK